MSNFRSEIYNKILLEEDSNAKKEMEKRLNELNCLYCFDLHLFSFQTPIKKVIKI